MGRAVTWAQKRELIRLLDDLHRGVEELRGSRLKADVVYAGYAANREAVRHSVRQETIAEMVARGRLSAEDAPR